MAGAAYSSRIELYTDCDGFEARVGLIRNYYQLKFLDFDVQSFSGCFRLDSAAMLLEFCRVNPDFHVVSCVAPGRYVNYYEPGDHVYFLADGDSDPSVVLNHLISPEWQLEYEDSICAARAELDKFRNHRKV
ncbi:MAG: hypothetical protein FJ146_17700 [Deltaproteobacteria bacterium]|nr:hypothetical protein [Deltaproteobacteria bacterium]